MHGRRYGDDRAEVLETVRPDASFPDGVGAFLEEDGAYTTLASAVSMLVVLSLAFTVAAAVWGMSRAGDVQACADSTALSGANVVASYSTLATVVDASVLSLGIAGLTMTGVGIVGLFVPGAAELAAKTIDAGVKTLRMRNDFAKSAAKGLAAVEKSLPVLVAARSMGAAAAQTGEASSFRGVALAVPMTSASEFSAVERQVPLDDLEKSADRLEKAAAELEEVSEKAAEAKRRAWLADCGRTGRNMQERAASLTGLDASRNPDYASSVSWSPEVGLERARAYYRWRLDREAPKSGGVEAAADSAARAAFYEFALEEVSRARIVSTDDSFETTLEPLPKNTAEVRGTSLYTDARWPATAEGAGRTLHYASSCPGATGGRSGTASFADIEAGRVSMCPECRFDVGDVGKTPAASTSIDNGFEYHLREFTLALEEYSVWRNEEIALERRARADGETAVGSIGDAFDSLADRPRIAPPGRYGCVAVATSSTAGQGSSPFAASVDVGDRAGVSAATLAPEPVEDGNVLSEFLAGVEARAGEGGAVGLVGGVMDLWGSLLVSYGDVAAAADDVMDGLLGGLDALGGGALADWLAAGISGTVDSIGLAPVDMRLKKPVLANTQSVFAKAGADGLSDVQDLARRIPAGASDPAAALEALGYKAGEALLDEKVTLAEIPIPGTDMVVPLTVRLRDVVGAAS